MQKPFSLTLFGHPRWKWVALFLISELVTLLGLLHVATGGAMAWMGWTAAAFFAPGMAVGIIQLCRPRPVFRLENEFVVRRSSWSSLAYLAVCSGWFVGSVLLLGHRPEAAFVAWPLIYLCAFGALLALIQFFDTRPLMIIIERGFFDRSLGVGYIPWKEIQGASIQPVQGTDVICLALANPERVLGKRTGWQRFVSRLNQLAGFELLHLGVVRMDAAYTDQALDFILARCGAGSEADPYQELLQLGR